MIRITGTILGIGTVIIMGTVTGTGTRSGTVRNWNGNGQERERSRTGTGTFFDSRRIKKVTGVAMLLIQVIIKKIYC